MTVDHGRTRTVSAAAARCIPRAASASVAQPIASLSAVTSPPAPRETTETEHAPMRRRIEDQKLDLLPLLPLILPPHDADGFLKRLARQKQFPIQRMRRQLVDEPIRRMQHIPQPRE